jgi:WD40 repeat protein
VVNAAKEADLREVQLRSIFDGTSIVTAQVEHPADLIALSPNGNLLAVAGQFAGADSGWIRVWPSPKGNERGWTYSGHADSLQLNEGGGRMVAVEHTVVGKGTRGERSVASEMIYDIATGKKLGAPATAPAPERAAPLEAESGRKFQVHLTSTGAVAVWTSDGTEVARIENSERVDQAVVSSDGRFLATAGASGIVRIWPLLQRDLHTLACSRLTRDFTDAERQTYLDSSATVRACRR